MSALTGSIQLLFHGSNIDALRDSSLLNPRKLYLYLAQPNDTGADFKPVVNSNPNLSFIYINEDAGFEDEREKDCVESIANARQGIFQMLPNLLQDMGWEGTDCYSS